MRELARRRGLGERVRIRSAGTHDYHVGECPDARAIGHAKRRGYDLTPLRASQVSRRDFDEYDYILAMDRTHLRILRTLSPPNARARVGLFLEASARWKGEDVADPYYGGPEGFEAVLDQVEEAAAAWLDRIEAELDPGRFRLEGKR